MLYDLSWCSCLYVNFDLGMRRGDVMESGDEAKNGAGDDILTQSGHLRGSRYARGTRFSVAITINRQSLRSLPGPSGARRVFAWSCVIHEPTALTALGPPPSESRLPCPTCLLSYMYRSYETPALLNNSVKRKSFPRSLYPSSKRNLCRHDSRTKNP